MSKSYKVKSGDTLNRIAVKYYGQPKKWTDIAKANPQLAGRKTAVDGSPLIFPGDVLIIPEEVKKDLAPQPIKQTIVLDENAPSDFSIVINGKKFTGFTGCSLVRSVFGVDAFSFSTAWDSKSKELRDAFRPFSYAPCDVYFSTDLVFKGRLLTPTPSVSPDAQVLNIQGYPQCGVLIDSCLPPSLYPSEYNGLDLKQIAEKVCEPFGVNVTVKGDVGATFEKVEVELTDKVWDFLSKLAEQRNMFLTNTADGGLLIYKPETEEVSATFLQGEVPFISCQPEFDAQKMFSHVTGYTKTNNSKPSSKYTYENELLIKKGILRCYAKVVDDATEGTLEESVKAMAGKMFAESVKYKLKVSGYRDKDGKLFRENIAVSVKASGAEIYKETKLLVDEVVLKRDDSSGMTAEFTLVMPGSRDGTLPEVYPWEE